MTPLLVQTMRSEGQGKGAEGRGGVAGQGGTVGGGSAPGNSVWMGAGWSVGGGGRWSQTSSQLWQCLGVEASRTTDLRQNFPGCDPGASRGLWEAGPSQDHARLVKRKDKRSQACACSHQDSTWKINAGKGPRTRVL